MNFRTLPTPTGTTNDLFRPVVLNVERVAVTLSRSTIEDRREVSPEFGAVLPFPAMDRRGSAPAKRCIVTVAQRTTFVKPAEILGANAPKWFVIDANGQVVGRLATQIATVLMGKHKPCYTPHVDCGDYVVVVNADKVKFVGSEMVHPRMDYYSTKAAKKKYYRHSEFVGGLKELSVEQLWDKHPTDILKLAVRRMLPKNALARHMLDKLKLYTTDNHPHQSQCPQPFPEHLQPA